LEWERVKEDYEKEADPRDKERWGGKRLIALG
jgi:hypothetical protein